MAKEGHCCDWISTLPDSILYLILSFLPTNQAVATSVLSKRWQPLWRLVPTLDFDDWIYTYKRKEVRARAIHSVSALIFLHHPLHKFRIRWVCGFTDPAYITVWVNAAVQRRVHHLDLSVGFVHRSTPINLSSVFNCKTLTVLKLVGCKLDPFSSVHLPSLHVLHIENLIFSGKQECLAKLLSGFLVNLLSGCPVLEDFTEISLCPLQDLQIGGHVPRNLTEFQMLPNLLRADISISYADFMLKMVNNVKFLHIDGIAKSIVRDPDSYVFPIFHNLTHIEYQNYIRNWSEVVELVKHCPKLQVLVIYQPDNDVGEYLEKEYPPSMLHLKLCTQDYEIARYIAEDSKDLMQWRWPVRE